MGFLCGVLLVLAGAYYMFDGFMMFGRVDNIMQQDFVQSRLIGGIVLFALGCVVFLLSSISEALQKLVKKAEGFPVIAAAAAPAPGANASTDTKSVPAHLRKWSCIACGKDNPSQATVCTCGASRV